MNCVVYVLFIIWTCVLIINVDKTVCSIHKNVKYFETMHATELEHKIVKRGLQESSHPFNKIKEVSFKTLGRLTPLRCSKQISFSRWPLLGLVQVTANASCQKITIKLPSLRDFRMILTPKRGVLHSKFQAISVDGDGNEKPIAVDHENFYDGRIFGETWSDASVHLEDGVMTATIQLPDETYHIEPSWRHLPHLGNESMVAYRASDVQFSWDHDKDGNKKPHQPCAYVKEGSEIEDNEDEEPEDDISIGKARWKRQADQYEETPTKTRCPLLLVADYRFYQEMGGSNTKTTINYLISLIDRVHKIYNDTTWQDRQEQDGFKGMGFVIKKIVVHSEPTRVRGGEAHYNMVREKWDVRNLLERFSPCSLRSIRKVLQAKSGRCFSEPEESFCGNLRVEGDEECDAGLLGSEDNDPCCDKVCKLRRNQGAVCSDKNSPCCQNCQFMASGMKCREAQYATCEQESRCTGMSSECPRSPPMSDGTGCLEKGQCRNGKCVPYCETQGLQSCMCDIILDACKRCCRMNLNDTCFPVDPLDMLPDGTPCIQGFCNKGICEKTIQDVVERFWDIIEDININKVILFLRDNVVGTVILVTAIIWIPASCIISYVDRCRLRKEEKRREWKQTDAFTYPTDTRCVVIHTRVPRHTGRTAQH